MNLKLLATVCALGAAALQAHADPVSGSTGGTWVNPIPSGGTLVTTGVGTSTFGWGDGSAFGVGANSLVFAGVGFASTTETPFKVGTVTYFNGTVAAGTDPDSVELALDLDFASPIIGHVVSNYTFGLVATTNTSDPDASADYVYLPSAFSSTSFAIGATTYSVKLTGFQNIVGDGFLTSDASQLNVREGLTASADLYAVVTTLTPAIPEPETYALMLAGLAALAAVARRRAGRAETPGFPVVRGC